MNNLDFDNVKLEQLKKESDLPKAVEGQVEETWLVNYNDETIGVGLFLPDSDKCVMAIIGNSDDDKVVLGSYGTSDDHAKLISHALEISFQGYLRSVRGDTVLGDPPIDEMLDE
ncbi:hypothetical protein FXV77_09045 [Sphingobacterium phlebotomi]|uniref:Uncharacterized protein n=1 Tax=Sphingobacterium phlebotomi TaxID=2605433 RepID=A0A5D4H7H4_9SPHI|nr:hypothetical protein [Sphingobacterium phlebotomi]TYR36638.1 hypothetical protein FXV77_09045 [Sphingobacterium phlebotomi]